MFSKIFRPHFFATKTPYAFLSSPSSSFATVRAGPLTKRHFSNIDTMPPVEQFVDDTIAKNKIVVFSKSHCPFCRATKHYFADRYPSESVTVVELDRRKDGFAIQDYLSEKTGGSTVPRGVFVGGNDDLHGKSKSEVDKLLAKRS